MVLQIARNGILSIKTAKKIATSPKRFIVDRSFPARILQLAESAQSIESASQDADKM